MKQQIKNRVKCLLGSLLLLAMALTGIHKPVTVYATSATLTFTADKKSVSVGDTFYVVVVLDSSEKIGGFEGYISYDSSMAEFVTGGNFVNGGDGLLRINEMDSTEPLATKKYSLQFKAKKTGDCRFDTSDAPAVYSDNGEELSVSSNKLTVSISNSETLSKNNNLKKLLISPGTLNQEYSNEVTAYETEIPYENDMLFISAEPEDEDAVVTVEGNEGLKVGQNYVHVIISAPSGAKRDIQIAVTRLEADASNHNSQQTVENGITITTGEEDIITLQVQHKYQIADLKDTAIIPEGYEETSIMLEGQAVQAFVESRNKESEFLLFYLTNENGETDFYQYDRVEKTIQRYEGQQTFEKPAEDDVLNVDDSQKETPYIILIAALAGLVIVLAAALTVSVLKHRK